MSEVTALETRVTELERKLHDFARRLEDMVSATSDNHRDIATLSAKIDGIREDLQDIKKMGDAFVPRPEFEQRMKATEKRVYNLEEMIQDLGDKLSETHLALADKLNKNTVATYGILITLLLSVIGMLAAPLIEAALK